MYKVLTDMGLNVAYPDGAFYLFIQIPDWFKVPAWTSAQSLPTKQR